MTERAGETIVREYRSIPKKVICCKGSKHYFGDSCVSPGYLDDLAQDLGESMHESVIALIPANRPGNLAHERLGAVTGTELHPCILARFVEPGLIRKEEHVIDTLCPLKRIWGTFLCLLMIWIWKYASFRSIVTNQLFGWIWDRIDFTVNILNLLVLSARLKWRKSNIGHKPPSFLGDNKVSAVKTWLHLRGMYFFYSPFPQPRWHLLSQHCGFFWTHNRGKNPVERRQAFVVRNTHCETSGKRSHTPLMASRLPSAAVMSPHVLEFPSTENSRHP